MHWFLLLRCYVPLLLDQAHKSKHIVVLGWDVDETLEGLLLGLGDFAPEGSEVTIISPEAPPDLAPKCGTCQCQHLEGHIASRQVLDQVSLLAPLLTLALLEGESPDPNMAHAQLIRV